MALIESKKLIDSHLTRLYYEDGTSTLAVPVENIIKIEQEEESKEKHWFGVFAPYTELRLVHYKCPACGVASANQPNQCPRCGTRLLKYEEKA